MRTRLILAMIAVLSALANGQADKRRLINSKHDFRPSSSAAIRAASGPTASDQLCVYCHTPHNANPGPLLWNQKMSTSQFATYASSTMQSTVSPVTAQDSSKLCLSCHDGTIALGSTTSNGDIPFIQGAGFLLPSSSRSNIAGFAGLGFADDHPFAFAPNYTNTQIKAPDPNDPVKLVAGKLQCSSCHDPHNEATDPVQADFLVKKNQASAICLSCHEVTGWNNSAHKQSPDLTEDSKYTSLQGAHTGYSGMANNGCESCHRPHAPGVPQRLVKFPEETVCYQCHDGSVAALNIKAEFTTKTYRHPVATTPSVHDASENPNATQAPMPETSASTQRHAECFDCHNSHATQAPLAGVASLAPNVPPALMNVKGQSSTNAYQIQSASEYEVCFKCHGDSANKPQTNDITLSGTGYGRNPMRQADFPGTLLTNPLPTRANTRLEFTTRNSFHPVTQASNLSTGTSGDVPSLRSFMVASDGITDITSRPLNSGSLIYCGDCHNNDTGRNLVIGNTAPAGPHGSNFVHILEREYAYEVAPAQPGQPTSSAGASPANYALCDKCHAVQNSILQDKSFPLHNLHVNSGATCSTCHDAHSAASPMLINFDLAIVGPATTAGTIQYLRTSPKHGSCTLSCHGHDHEASPY